MKSFAKASLKNKLLISYILLIIIPFFISTIVLSLSSSRNIKNNSLTYISLFSEQISSNINTYIGEMDRMTRTAILDDTLCQILTNPKYLTGLDSYIANKYVNNEILKLMTQKPDIVNITYTGANGAIFSGSSNSIKDVELFNEITHAFGPTDENENIYISSAHVPNYLSVHMQNKERPNFTITRYLYTVDKQYIGSIVLCIPCQDLLNAININLKLIDNGVRIVITNSENFILADTSSDFTAESLNNPDYYYFDPYQNNKNYMYFNSYTDDLTTTVMVNKSQLFESTNKFIQLSILLIMLLIIVIILLSFYFSRKLIEPIELLQYAAIECADGNYDVKIPVYTEDEIGQLCISFNYMTEQIQNLLNKVYHYQLANKQSQLEALQNQINPHFLHNTLEIIRMKALINKDEEVAEMVQTLAKLFRITLDRTTNTVSIKDELEHVKTYLTIQNMRFNNRFKFICNIPDSFLDYSIIKLSFQPLVENSINHGFSKTYDDESITISIEENQDNLYIYISDNGMGINITDMEILKNRINHKSKENKSLRASIGIVNIADRIQLEYGKNYYLDIYENQPQGTIVKMKIPKSKSM